jgi:hypothetical protein
MFNFRETRYHEDMMQKLARMLAVLALVALPATALAQQAPIGTTLLGSQTVLNGTLEQDLSSKSTQVNDPFVLDVQAPFPGDDQRFQGARILGHVESVSHAGGTHKGGLQLAFDRLVLADGTEATLTGEVLSVQAQKGGSTTGRAIVGAVLGQIVGNYIGKHIGSDVGGAVGAIGGGVYAASLGTNITLGKGTVVKLQTTQPTTVTGRRQATYNNTTPSYASTPQPYPQPH